MLTGSLEAYKGIHMDSCFLIDSELNYSYRQSRVVVFSFVRKHSVPFVIVAVCNDPSCIFFLNHNP